MPATQKKHEGKMPSPRAGGTPATQKKHEGRMPSPRKKQKKHEGKMPSPRAGGTPASHGQDAHATTLRQLHALLGEELLRIAVEDGVAVFVGDLG
jgi:hypothetical protein